MTELTVIVICLIAFIAWREWGWAKERATLLQRIQAPEIAVQEFSERPSNRPVLAIPVDDDEAFREAKERLMNGAE